MKNEIELSEYYCIFCNKIMIKDTIYGLNADYCKSCNYVISKISPCNANNYSHKMTYCSINTNTLNVEIMLYTRITNNKYYYTKNIYLSDPKFKINEHIPYHHFSQQNETQLKLLSKYINDNIQMFFKNNQIKNDLVINGKVNEKYMKIVKEIVNKYEKSLILL